MISKPFQMIVSFRASFLTSIRFVCSALAGVVILGTKLPAAPTSHLSNATLVLERNTDPESCRASWWGQVGKTYFSQYSEDLVKWIYAPDVRAGYGAKIYQGFETEGAKRFFVRLIHTDEFAPDPQLADFDQDGIANIVELQRGSDPFNPSSTGGMTGEVARVRLESIKLPNQQLVNGQVLHSSPTGTAKVVLSQNSSGSVQQGVLSWGGGVPGSYRGLLSDLAPANTGRAAIATTMTSGQGDVTAFLGFTANGSLEGLNGTGSMSLTLQRFSNNSQNRLFTNAGSNTQWAEMHHVISLNTPYRTMVRREDDGFSSWIQGGIFSDTGAVVNSATWFPIARWRGVNPNTGLRAGLYNSWAGPTQNTEFADIVNPPMDATSALLDYERNKFGLHVPSLLKFPGGGLIAAWQNATTHESVDCEIKMAIRDQLGVWGPVSTVLAAGADGASNNGPVLHKVHDEIWLTYQSVTDGVYSVRKRQVTIAANAFSLSAPVTFFNKGLLINHSLHLTSGRLIACWHTQDSQWKNRISYSDDNGQSWRVASMPEFTWRAGEGFAAIEEDGTIASYWRTDRTAIYRSTSVDHGETWTALTRTEIPCVNMPSQGLIGSRVCGYKRPSDGKLVLIGNNSTTQREKLTAWLVKNGVVEGVQSLMPWDVTDGSAEGLHYPDLIVHPDDSMTVIFARWLGGAYGSSTIHSAINTFKVRAAFE